MNLRSVHLAATTLAVIALGVPRRAPGQTVAPPVFTVTFRLADGVIGPVKAWDVVVPRRDHSDAWVTLSPGPAAARLTTEANAAAASERAGKVVRTGTCEIVVRDHRGARLRTYALAGCWIAGVDGAQRGDRARLHVEIAFTTLRIS